MHITFSRFALQRASATRRRPLCYDTSSIRENLLLLFARPAARRAARCDELFSRLCVTGPCVFMEHRIRCLSSDSKTDSVVRRHAGCAVHLRARAKESVSSGPPGRLFRIPTTREGIMRDVDVVATEAALAEAVRRARVSLDYLRVECRGIQRMCAAAYGHPLPRTLRSPSTSQSILERGGHIMSGISLSTHG